MYWWCGGVGLEGSEEARGGGGVGLGGREEVRGGGRTFGLLAHPSFFSSPGMWHTRALSYG